MWPIAADVLTCLCVTMSVCDVMTRYPTKTAGTIEIPFGMWGGVGHSNHVLDGGLDPPMVMGNYGGISSPLKSLGIACSQVFSMPHDTCHPLAKDAEAIRQVRHRICEQKVEGSIPGPGDAVQRL